MIARLGLFLRETICPSAAWAADDSPILNACSHFFDAGSHMTTER